MKEKLNDQFVRAITLKQLRALAATAKTGTIVQAANELGVTPPAVSLQLKLLESIAGVALFDRTKEGMRLTDAGRSMLTIGARIEAALAECSESIRVMKGLGAGRVSVAVISTAKYFAPRLLAAFAVAHPGLEVRLAVGNRQDTIAALEQLDVDIAIMGRPPESVEVQQQVIGDHPHVIIAAPTHRLATQRNIELCELAKEKFLLREPGSGTRILMESMLAKADIAPQIGMELGSNETIKQAVMAGLGIAFISAHTVAAEIEAGRLCTLAFKGLPIVRQWYAVRHREKNLLPAGAAMWEFLVSEGSKFLPDVSALILPEQDAAGEPSEKSGGKRARRIREFTKASSPEARDFEPGRA